jgi:Ca-activated chloride channel homolog
MTDNQVEGMLGREAIITFLRTPQELGHSRHINGQRRIVTMQTVTKISRVEISRSMTATGKVPDIVSASVPTTLAALHVNPEAGLTRVEVGARWKAHGYNEVTEQKGHPVLTFLGKFWGLSAWMLELIMVLSAVLRKYSDLAVVGALLVVNAVLSFMQERRAAGVVETLRRRLQVSARVLREASGQVIPAPGQKKNRREVSHGLLRCYSKQKGKNRHFADCGVPSSETTGGAMGALTRMHWTNRADWAQVVKVIAFVILFVALNPFRFLASKTTTDPGRHNLITKSSTLKEDLNPVLVNATVTDHRHRYITGLEAADFRIFEGKVEEKISHFTPDDRPASIGLLLDVSGSMSDKLAMAKEAACTLLRTLSSNDEVFLLTFASRPVLETDFTSHMEEIQNRLTFERARGGTSIYDAVDLGLEKMEKAHNPKRALILITDGEDTASRHPFASVRNALKEADCQVLVVSVAPQADPEPYPAVSYMDFLTEMADISGGEAYFPGSADEFNGICKGIAAEINNEYILGYRPTNVPHDGHWQKITVKMRNSNGAPPRSVHAKAGYYAPVE